MSSRNRNSNISNSNMGGLLGERVVLENVVDHHNGCSCSSGGYAERMAEDVVGCTGSLVEPTVERMLSSRVSVGMIHRETKNKIKDALERRILPHQANNQNINSNSNNSSYALSPILKYMKERCYSNGTIYVAYVPRGMGKTTSCYAFAKSNPNNQVLALVSPTDTSTSNSTSTTCIERMVSLFNLRWGSVPQGFVTTLIKSLTTTSKKKNLIGITRRRRRRNNNNEKDRSYLLIDEFMPNGINISDKKLVLHLMKLIGGTNVCVFLLTPNKESADFLLTLNNSSSSSGTIQPLVETSVLNSLLQRTTTTSSFELDFDFWDMYCCMEWDDESIQEAILGFDEFVDLTKETKLLVKEEIKEILTYNMTDEERKNTNPLNVKRKLLYSNHKTQAYTFNNNNNNNNTKMSGSISSSTYKRIASSSSSIGSKIVTSIVQRRSNNTTTTLIDDSQITNNIIGGDSSYVEMV